MITPTHIAASYLISQIPGLFNQPLNTSEVLAVILAGNVIDLDYFWGMMINKKGDEHHNFVTHTPIFTITLWISLFIVFNNLFSSNAWLVILISGLIHLVLDDIGYWFCRLGWQEISKYQQINWFYPITPFVERKFDGNNKKFMKIYLKKAKVNVLVEVLLIVIALVLFIRI